MKPPSGGFAFGGINRKFPAALSPDSWHLVDIHGEFGMCSGLPLRSLTKLGTVRI